jgi:fucose 4-O-acetylase-like acetyltransferase
VYYPQEIATPTGRIYFLDNLKYILITLVVMCHAIEPFLEYSLSLKALWMYSEIFVMPLFVFVSGYNSKHATNSNNILNISKVCSFMILYIILFVAIDIIRFINGGDFSYHFLSVSNASWYLFAMCLWYLLLPVFSKIKPAIAIPFTIVFALLIGYYSEASDFLVMSRVICFFPVFLSGYFLKADVISKLVKTRFVFRILALIFLVGLLFIVYRYLPIAYQFRPIVTARNPYINMANPEIGVYARFFWYIAIVLTGIAIFLLIPRCKTFFTKLGARTLQIYILHAIIKNIIWMTPVYFLLVDGLSKDGIFIELLLVFSAFIVAFILSWKPLGVPFNKITSINFGFLNYASSQQTNQKIQ